MVMLGSFDCASGLGSWFSFWGIMDSGSCGEVFSGVAWFFGITGKDSMEGWTGGSSEEVTDPESYSSCEPESEHDSESDSEP